MRTALLPGSFDPPSIGHLDLIKRSFHFCDRLILAIAEKPDKKPQALFSIEERKEMLRRITHSMPHVEITHFKGLTVDFARERQVHFIIRGLRTFSDYLCELQMAAVNRRLSGIETLFIMADERLAQISSSLIREIAHFKGPLSEFVPEEIISLVQKK